VIEYVLNAKSGAEWELDHADAVESVKRLPKNKSWKVVITEYREDRSARQNKALFGHAYRIMGNETGYRPDELHSIFCRKFFGTDRSEVLGVRYEKPVRTTTTDETGKRSLIDTKTFSEFYAMVEQQAAEIGVVIPPPDPNWFRDR
jgi:hypothetical protein